MTHSQAVTSPRLFSGSSTLLCLLLSRSLLPHTRLRTALVNGASGRGQSDGDDKTLACCTLIGGFKLCNQCHCRRIPPPFLSSSPPLPPPLTLPLSLSEAVFQRGYLLLTERRGLTQPLISSAFRCSDRPTEELHTHLTAFLFCSLFRTQCACFEDTFPVIGVELLGKRLVLFTLAL